jgi:hypothetical protein
MNDLHECNVHNRDWYYDCFVCEAIQIAEKLAEAEFLRVILKMQKKSASTEKIENN